MSTSRKVPPLKSTAASTSRPTTSIPPSTRTRATASSRIIPMNLSSTSTRLSKNRARIRWMRCTKATHLNSSTTNSKRTLLRTLLRRLMMPRTAPIYARREQSSMRSSNRVKWKRSKIWLPYLQTMKVNPLTQVSNLAKLGKGTCMAQPRRETWQQTRPWRATVKARLLPKPHAFLKKKTPIPRPISSWAQMRGNLLWPAMRSAREGIKEPRKIRLVPLLVRPPFPPNVEYN